MIWKHKMLVVAFISLFLSIVFMFVFTIPHQVYVNDHNFPKNRDMDIGQYAYNMQKYPDFDISVGFWLPCSAVGMVCLCEYCFDFFDWLDDVKLNIINKYKKFRNKKKNIYISD